MKNLFKNTGLLVAFSTVLFSCYNPDQRAFEETDATKNVGLEYAPQMYHSEPYEPLKQVIDREAGLNYWPFNEVGTGHGEFYNSNDYNPHSMNMRVPAANTVRMGELPYRVPKDSFDLAAKVKSPFQPEEEMVVENGDSTYALTDAGREQMKDSKNLYLRFCSHCHGKDGQADGPVAEKFGGVPMYNSAAIKDKPIGHIFHVITYGKGRMGAHGSQLSQLERWKIASYVQTLQKK